MAFQLPLGQFDQILVVGGGIIRKRLRCGDHDMKQPIVKLKGIPLFSVSGGLSSSCNHPYRPHFEVSFSHLFTGNKQLM